MGALLELKVPHLSCQRGLVMAGLFRGLNQIIPSKPSLARPASGFFLFFCLDFTMKLQKVECLLVGWQGIGEVRKARDPFLASEFLGHPPFSLAV